MDDVVERAKALAHKAHAGQTDKAGRPYIEHVARVAAAVSDNPVCEAVAWLHDVLEDCPEFAGDVYAFPEGVWIAAVLLDRGGSEAGYYERISASPVARRVKLADIADNNSAERLALLDAETATRLRKKYAKALSALGVTP